MRRRHAAAGLGLEAPATKNREAVFRPTLSMWSPRIKAANDFIPPSHCSRQVWAETALKRQVQDRNQRAITPRYTCYCSIWCNGSTGGVGIGGLSPPNGSHAQRRSKRSEKRSATKGRYISLKHKGERYAGDRVNPSIVPTSLLDRARRQAIAQTYRLAAERRAAA
jgi:hypothetical protein